MQRLYDSEIHVAVSSFWDNGFYVKLATRGTALWQRALPDLDDVEQWVTATGARSLLDNRICPRRRLTPAPAMR